MMESRQVTYEVLVGDGSRWDIDSVHQAKAIATSRAQSLLGSGQHKTVKVTREIGNAGSVTIFQQEDETRADKAITISPIDDAAICSEPGDLMTFEARKTTGRLLRKYLDRHNLTALELLHDYGQLRNLRRTDRLFYQAIHRIAAVQARTLDADASARIDLLNGLADEATKRARDVGDRAAFVKIMNDEGLPATLRAIGAATEPDRRQYFIHAVLAAYIGQDRDWRAKLGLVLDLLERQPDDDARILLDELAAEIMDGAESIGAILAAPPDIATALRLMIQLATGQYSPAGRADPLLDRFDRVMKGRDLPTTRGILLERAAREMSGTRPLTRESDEADRAAFPTLLKLMIAPAGLHGGVAMSEAVTRRARIAMKNGDEDLSPEDAIALILAMLPNRAVGLGYVLELHQSDFGDKYRAVVLTTLLDSVKSLNALSDLLPADRGSEDFVAAVHDLRRRIGEDALGGEINVLIAQKLDHILTQGEAGAPGPVLPAEIAPEPPSNRNGLGKRVYPPGEVIFEEGGPGDEAFMILSGEIEICTRSGKDQTVLALLGRGEIFGEMALVDDQPRMATARATMETEVSVVPQEVFKKRLSWLAEEDRLIAHIMEILVTRLRQQGAD